MIETVDFNFLQHGLTLCNTHNSPGYDQWNFVDSTYSPTDEIRYYLGPNIRGDGIMDIFRAVDSYFMCVLKGHLPIYSKELGWFKGPNEAPFGISRETVLYYFGCLFNDTTPIKHERIYNWKVNSFNEIVGVVDEPGISLHTLDLVAEMLLDRWLVGLRFQDIETLLYFFVVVRVMSLSIRYNPFNVIVITICSLLACHVYYKNFVGLISKYGEIFKEMETTEWLVAQIDMKKDFVKINHRANPIVLFIRGMTDSWRWGADNIDPISIWVRKIPDSVYRPWVFRIYYFFKNTFLPFWYKFYVYEGRKAVGILKYQYSTRVFKKYVPYIFRWHYTFTMLYSTLIGPINGIVLRTVRYKSFILEPYIEDYHKIEKIKDALFKADPKNYVPPPELILADELIKQYDDAVIQSFWIDECMYILLYIQISFLAIAFLHALFGQYFYFPFVVENVDLHVGKRPKRSIYSGGFTAWQDRDKSYGASTLPVYWWGMFGRGTDTYFYHNWPLFGRLADFLDHIDLFNLQRNYKRFRKILKKFYKKIRNNRRRRRKRRKRRKNNRK